MFLRENKEDWKNQWKRKKNGHAEGGAGRRQNRNAERKKLKKTTGRVDSKGGWDKNLSRELVYTQSPQVSNQSPLLFSRVNTHSLLCHSAAWQDWLFPKRSPTRLAGALRPPKIFFCCRPNPLFEQPPFILGLAGLAFFNTLLDSCSLSVVTCQLLQAVRGMVEGGGYARKESGKTATFFQMHI